MAGSSTMTGMTTLEALDHWAGTTPKKVAFTFLDDVGEEVARLTFAGLRDESTALAAHLLGEVGLKRGETCLLVYPPSLDFLLAFLACLRAGVVAVPVFPPDPRRLRKDLHMFEAVQRSCGARVALTSAAYNYAKKMADIKALFTASGSAWPELRWAVTDNLPAAAARRGGSAASPPAAPSVDDVAFLQYTSGSTSEPKGVMITHGNLAHNLSLIVNGLAARDDTVVVSWLPQYHDMGLIGSCLGCLYCGGSGFYMSPAAFIKQPPLWLELVSRHRATHLQAPNFAYALVSRKFLAADPRPALDLSSVRHMINAAEPVDAAVVDRFEATFAPYGLRRGVVFPTYGLAEHTVFVCSNGAGRVVVDRTVLEEQRQAKPVDKLMLWAYAQPGAGALGSGEEGVKTAVMVGCGRPGDAAGVDLQIVHEETAAPLPEGGVGEVWLRSPSKAAGYWGLPERSREDFEAQLAEGAAKDTGGANGGGPNGGGGGGGGYLRTGDLGFLWQGELYICGRLKDMIIIRGRNHFPQDIERTAEAEKPANNGSGGGGEFLRPGSAAAFSMPLRPGGAEALLLVAEAADPRAADDAAAAAAAVAAVRNAVSGVHGVALAGIALLRPRTVPKTTSGKIARAWCRRAYAAGTLDALYHWRDPAAGDMEDGEDGVDGTGVDRVSGAGGSAAARGSSGVDDDEVVADRSALSEARVLELIAAEVSKVLRIPAADIPTDAPLGAIGLDSMEGLQLLALLERRFAVKLPEEIMMEEDTTLAALVPVIIAGGIVHERPVCVDCGQLAALERVDGPPRAFDAAEAVERRRQARAARASRKAGFTTGRFKPGELAAVTPLAPRAAAVAALLLAALLLGTVAPPLVSILAASRLSTAAAVGVAIAMALLPHAVARFGAYRFPAAGRYSPLRPLLLDFFSFKMVFEAGPPPPGTYIFHGVGAGVVAQLCAASAAPSAAGCHLHPTHGGMLATSPLFRALFALLGGGGAVQPALRRGESVMLLGSVAGDGNGGGKGEGGGVSAEASCGLAADNGAQVVPCLVLSGAASGFGRRPVTVVCGKPVRVQSKDGASGSGRALAANAAAAKVEAEVARMAEVYAEAFGADRRASRLPAAA